MTTTLVETGLKIESLRTPGLGDSTYLLTYQGSGILVDPQRDVDRFLDRLDGTELRWVLETHLHNDYVSGGVEAARRSGAQLVVPAAAAPSYRHLPAFHLEDIGDRRLAIRPIHTPGHTPEHTSYLILIEGEPVALFSGGSLLVGSAGRSDLLGMDRADTLARLQYRSVRRLAGLPEEVGLYPTHGEGSFCTASGAGSTTSTIGAERATNPVLAYPDENAFVTGQLSGLAPYPTYYRHMGPANLRGGEPIAVTVPATLDTETVAGWQGEVTVVDIRDHLRFATAHIPGSLGVALRDDFGTWVGWLVDIDRPLVLVADPGQDVAEATVQLARIGYDKIRGVLWGVEDWVAAGYETWSHDTVGPTELTQAVERGEQILDVRAPAEYREQHLMGSVHHYVPDLEKADLGHLDPRRDVWVVCGTGYRASIAAGMLQTKGLRPKVLVGVGVPEVCRAAPRPICET